MNRLFKSVLSLILMLTIVISCTISFGATDNSKSVNDIHILNDKITLKNREVCFSTYNITKNNPTIASLVKEDDTKFVEIKAKDCVATPKKVSTPQGANYEFWTTFGGAKSGGGDFNFDNTAGVYRKMRVKLSHYEAFNEDGSYIDDDHNYRFGDIEYVGESVFKSSLIIISGGMITFVAPDKNGYIEFYASTDIGEKTTYHTFFDYKIKNSTQNITGSGGAVTFDMYDFLKGGGSIGYITINSVTDIQRYIAKAIDFDKMQRYRADVDNNGDITVLDATRIQLYLARAGKL